ncbi:nucleotidyltransferase family protein [Candidatus Roizmanbacteria bacterium]|nr:nucleotidyltransferase family protein [Candidatus Roizmanbacteria bacterium]
MKNISKHSVLTELKALLPELVTRYKVQGLELFGSVVREEQHEKSDIDLLVEFGENADMFDLVGLSLFLEEKLRRKVDVVPKRALRSELQSAVLADAIVV